MMDETKFETIIDLLAGELLRQREEVALSKARIRDLERKIEEAEARLPKPGKPRVETRKGEKE